MSQQSNLQGLFERPTTLPDPDAQGRLARLVGMDDKIKRLANVDGRLSHGMPWRRRFFPSNALPAAQPAGATCCALPALPSCPAQPAT